MDERVSEHDDGAGQAERVDEYFPDGQWTHATWAERVNRGLEKTVVFTPIESMTCGINGVMYYLEKDKEIELPYPFYWHYEEAMRTRRQAVPNAIGSLEKRAFGNGQVTTSPGWNGNVLE